MPLDRGLVQVYTGDGKGKTTAALGLALRAAGQGFSVHIVQFMKGGRTSGEVKALEWLPNISICRFGRAELVHPQRITAEDQEMAREALAHGREAIQSGRYDLVILDEINVALAWKLLDLQAVLDMLEAKPQGLELVLTGRGAPQEVIEVADLVTEMREVKHPYHQGLACRRGIDI